MRAGARAVLRAVELARAGRLASARGEVQALARGEDGVLVLAAAHVLHVTRDHQGGLDALWAARRLLPNEAPRILRRVIACAESLGWEREVARGCAEGRRVAPRDPAWDALELAMHRRGGDEEAALVCAERALELAPRWAALAMERAAILGRLGRREATVGAIERVLGLRGDGVYRCEAGRVLTEVGAFALAEAQWRAALADGATEAAGALAELCLRAGDRAGAVGWMGRMTEGAARVAGALAMAEGRFAAALEFFVGDGDSRTMLGRAEALLRLGRDAEAAAMLDAAGVGGREDNFVAGMLRLLLLARVSPEAVLRRPQIEAFAGALAEIGVVFAPGVTLAEAALIVEGALRSIAGSRAPPIGWCEGPVPGDMSQLRRFTRVGPRYAARRVLGMIRGAEVGRVLERFDGVIAEYPGSALPVCHRGELRLWLGDVAGAEADLQAALAIEPRTRWAYIGGTMAALLRGDPEAALEMDARGVAMMGGEGPAVHVHRGEALRRLGRVPAAIGELRRAVALHPGRVGAWINLGLAYAASGEREAMTGVFERLRTRCPGLVSDAALVCGVAAWGDSEAVAEAVQQVVLAQALVMLRGNRSSSLVTYVDRRGQLRVAQDGAPAGQGPHAGDARDLSQAAALVGG